MLFGTVSALHLESYYCRALQKVLKETLPLLRQSCEGILTLHILHLCLMKRTCGNKMDRHNRTVCLPILLLSGFSNMLPKWMAAAEHSQSCRHLAAATNPRETP